MRVHFVVVGQPRRKLPQHGLGIRSRAHAHIVPLDRPHERLSHTIALRALEWGGPGFEADLSRKAACLGRDVAGAVVGQPLDGLRQAIDLAEPVLDGGHHEITDLLASDPTGGRDIAHGLAITAVEGVGDTDPLAILAPDLKAIRAPAPIRLRDGDPAVMTPLRPTCMTLEQQAVLLYDPIDPLMVWGLPAFGQGSAA